MSPSSSSGWACASWIFRGDHTHGSGRSERAVAPSDRRVDGLGRKADARRPRGKRPADFRHAFERELKVRPRNAGNPMVSHVWMAPGMQGLSELTGRTRSLAVMCQAFGRGAMAAGLDGI